MRLFKSFAIAAALAVTVGAMPVTAYAEKTIKLAHLNKNDPFDNGTGAMAVVFKSLVESGTNGAVKVEIFPDGPGYEEKFYFEPGDTGFKVWNTRYGNVGVGICWDQWFPETARCLTLMGADMIFYPTAIGSEPEIGVDSASHWQRVQMGHSAANIIPVIAANRIGVEAGESCALTFYGSSFITDHTGAKVAEASRDKEEILYSEFDSAEIREHRHYWGLIRDRRPECYGEIVKR